MQLSFLFCFVFLNTLRGFILQLDLLLIARMQIKLPTLSEFICNIFITISTFFCVVHFARVHVRYGVVVAITAAGYVAGCGEQVDLTDFPFPSFKVSGVFHHIIVNPLKGKSFLHLHPAFSTNAPHFTFQQDPNSAHSFFALHFSIR